MRDYTEAQKRLLEEVRNNEYKLYQITTMDKVQGAIADSDTLTLELCCYTWHLLGRRKDGSMIIVDGGES